MIHFGLYRTSLRLLEDGPPGQMRLFRQQAPQPQAQPQQAPQTGDPTAQRKSYDLGYHHARRGKRSDPSKAADPRAYLAGYLKHRQEMRQAAPPAASAQAQQQPSAGAAPQQPQPAQSAGPLAPGQSPAAKLVNKRRCFSSGEAQAAVRNIHNALGQYGRHATISGQHLAKIKAHTQAALTAHPEDSRAHVHQAVTLMNRLGIKAPGEPGTARAPGETPSGKDPRLGHLFYGLPKKPEELNLGRTPLRAKGEVPQQPTPVGPQSSPTEREAEMKAGEGVRRRNYRLFREPVGAGV